MAKKQPAQFKVGIVSVREDRTPVKGQPVWHLRYTDPDSKADVRRTVTGLSHKQVREMADHMSRMAYQGKGLLASRPKIPTVEDGLREVIRLSGAREYVRKERARQGAFFVEWLARVYPDVKTWDELRPAMVLAYKLHLEQTEYAKQKKYAHQTIVHKLAVVKMAWQFMIDNYPESGMRPLPRIRLAAPPPREIQCLEPAEVAVLLDWLRAYAPDLWPMAMLQALCGLRMSEAAALRAQDVNLEAGTLTVCDTGRHKPKTSSSGRTIPLCGEALAALKQAVEGQKVIPPGGELFVNQKGSPWEFYALTHRWMRALRHAAARPEEMMRKHKKKLTLNPHGLNMPRLAQIPARKLRSAFATMTGLLDIPDRLVKRYMGHAPGDMLGGRYRHIPLSELRRVSSQMNTWRQLIKPAQECVRQDSGNIAGEEAVNN